MSSVSTEVKQSSLHKTRPTGRVARRTVPSQDSSLHMSADVTVGVFALAGAILGSLGIIAAQWQAGVERLAKLREAGQIPSPDEIRTATDEMWLG